MADAAAVDSLEKLAGFAANAQFEDFPAHVVARATWMLRDTVGVIIGGMGVPEVQNLAEYAAANYPGDVPLLVSGQGVRPAWAALVHGTAGTTLEMDEGHAYAYGHAAIHAVVTSLALAATHRLSGRETLTLMIVAYEVAARVGTASRLRDGVHPFGAWGVLGAAAAAARADGFDATRTSAALDVAASYAIAPSFNTAYEGATVRNTYAGMVNHNGLLAVEMVKLGFTGERGGAATAFGRILGEHFDADSVAADLGTHYEITRGYFKPYSACRYAHAAVDAALKLRETLPPLDTVRRVDVQTYRIAATLDGQAPTTPLGARFSIPYVVAAVLRHGHAWPEAFADDAIDDPATRELARKVHVAEDQAYTAMLPDRRAARISVQADDGLHTAEVLGSKGDPDQPMTADELRAKFNRLTTGQISAEHAGALWEQMGAFPAIDDLGAFFASPVLGSP